MGFPTDNQNDKKVTVFDYDNYRLFLSDVYSSSKSKDRKFSFRYFARLAGFQSPNFLKRVIDGDRNLTELSIDRLAKALKLNKEESHFFRHLVLLNQAKTTDERQRNAEQLLKSQVFKKIFPLKTSQFNYYAHWYFVPIREMVGMPEFKEDYEWISKKLIPSVSTAEVKKSVSQLIDLGLLTRDENGKLIQTEKDISTGDQLTSASLAQFHRTMSRMAGESIERIPRDQRQITSVTLALSKDAFRKIKEMVQQLQASIVESANEDADTEKVYQINFQLFPLSQAIKGETK